MSVRFLHCVFLALALLPLAPARAGDLTVSAASSLSDAFKEIATAFETRHPGTKVRLNIASSGTPLQQIARGAPVDVFASADVATLDAAASQGLIVSAQRRNFAGNDLVLIVPTGPGVSPAPVTHLADLASPAVRRIAIGNPASVPVGRYARAALESAGLWSQVEPRLINARNARQVLDYVARGEVDAGFVYATDAALMKEKLRV
ncbi:MAG: molybdate ABC transporter substrate-binding protein, partial [Gammaproteobacteria bacterium]